MESGNTIPPEISKALIEWFNIETVIYLSPHANAGRDLQLYFTRPDHIVEKVENESE